MPHDGIVESFETCVMGAIFLSRRLETKHPVLDDACRSHKDNQPAMNNELSRGLTGTAGVLGLDSVAQISFEL